MTDAIAHRGPNGQGQYIEGPVGLGHRRLSVIDLEGGSQPMIDSETGRVIVFNGEIFNFQEIRKELKSRGHSFRTNSDTEVLLRLVTSDVDAWIDKVNGMFAFAVWDPKDRSLLVVRDRFGVKPLYYIVNDRFFAFASEIKALFALPGVAAGLDRSAVSEYLAFRHVLEPTTLYRDVRQLPGGHSLLVSPDRASVTMSRYWYEQAAMLRLFPKESSDEELREVLSQAVRYRLVSDVPLGSFNSGGVDSSLISREVRNQKSGELHTFSMGFAESTHDESRFAEEVALSLGSIHHADSLTPDQYADLLPSAIWHNDEPLCHPHSVHLMRLCGIAKRFVTVVLTGEGADETFAGYPRLRIPLYASALGRLASEAGQALGVPARYFRMRRLEKLGEVLASRLAPAIDSHRYMGLDTLFALFGGEVEYAGSRRGVLNSVDPRQSRLEQLLEYERRSYMQSLVLRLDKMSMAHGLEARTPFLDFRFVLWSKRCQGRSKVGLGFANKPVLKREAARHFSRELVYRRKVGFGVPLAAWFRESAAFREMLSEVSGGQSRVGDLVDRSVVLRLVNEHRAGAADHSESLWVLLNLELWLRGLGDLPVARSDA